MQEEISLIRLMFEVGEGYGSSFGQGSGFIKKGAQVIGLKNENGSQRKDLLIMVGLQLLVSLSAILIFVRKIFAHRREAAIVAGSLFLALGVFQIYKSWLWPDRKRYLSFWSYHIYFWVMTLPLFLSRLLSSQSFDEIKILGLSGPTFHKLSELMFVVMFGCTLIDIWRCSRKLKVSD